MKILNFQNNVTVAEISGKGMGLVAARDFKKGDIVFIVSGKVRAHFSRYTVPVSATSIVDTALGSEMCTEAYYLNHSCEPSACLKDGALCVALRDITLGEEVNIHYGTLGNFGEEWAREDRICECGSKSCAGQVNGYNEFTEVEKARLEPLIQDWVKEKYGKVS